MIDSRFVPVHPPRQAAASPVWKTLFGEHGRNSIAGWSQAAFTDWYLRRNVFGTIVHIPRHPDAIQRVLLDNAANYRKPRIVKRVFAPLLGEGLFMAEGELWRTQRRIVAPSFAPGAVKRLPGLMVEAAERNMADWPASGRLDIAAVATRTTMHVIADALFSSDPRLTSEAATRHIDAALTAAGQVRLTALFGLPPLPLSRTARAGARGQRYLRSTLAAIVRERGRGGGEDFLGGVIRDLNERFAPREATALAIDNAATFYGAGHETTANTLAWAIYLLSRAPAAQARARAEAIAALDGDRDSLPDRLPYLRQVIDETLRLYPPAPRLEREARADDDLAGHPVRKGELVSVWPWLLHRHARLWDDPDAFDPERFAPGAGPERHRFQYIPFGGGPRVCVGARFATVEALVILAHWLAARRFEPAEGATILPVGSVTLRPMGGLTVRVAPV